MFIFKNQVQIRNFSLTLRMKVKHSILEVLGNGIEIEL